MQGLIFGKDGKQLEWVGVQEDEDLFEDADGKVAATVAPRSYWPVGTRIVFATHTRANSPNYDPSQAVEGWTRLDGGMIKTSDGWLNLPAEQQVPVTPLRRRESDGSLVITR